MSMKETSVNLIDLEADLDINRATKSKQEEEINIIICWEVFNRIKFWYLEILNIENV